MLSPSFSKGVLTEGPGCAADPARPFGISRSPQGGAIVRGSVLVKEDRLREANGPPVRKGILVAGRHGEARRLVCRVRRRPRPSDPARTYIGTVSGVL